MLIGRRLIALDVEGSGVKGGGTASVLAIGCWVAENLCVCVCRDESFSDIGDIIMSCLMKMIFLAIMAVHVS